ncbi:putative Serine/threonine-protein kinase SRPK3 [Glarea lozoyensis 74030]|uniref:non-specific serine/threonine protein kinase n=1 Tax=Glarea lozoyensis (strain ATCC 74030 / MF5533) TaxID=1104152 RepID=H0EKG1_GLAL7|nr:putative Serine/threonine-protein kinase SRPK3 [Glarea lozoyensis 74030]
MSADYGDLISDSDSDACEISSESEPADRYYDGTYYPICIGDVLHTRYRIIHKLGWGGFSTVWLARDEQTNEDVALKVLVAGSDGEKEYEVQKWVKESIEEGKREGLVLYKDAFQVQGMREEHRVLVMDVVGPNLDMTLLRMLLESHIKCYMVVELCMETSMKAP